MPFILNPKLARFFSRFQNKIKTQERFHSDGIKINSESPECLDEPFWINSTYSKLKFDNYLYPHELDDISIKSYAYLLEKYSNIECKKRIVIKNNNNHLRIFKLSKFLRNSKFLILFRSPLAHSKSLLSQHKRFIELQKKDIFLKEYMNYLGHWEFGENKKPFIYDENQYLELTSLDAKTIKYWMKQWIFTYDWILKNLSSNEYPNIRLICYEELCTNKRYENKLYDFLNLDDKKYYYKFKVGKSNKYLGKITNSEYINHAESIYDQMKKKSFFD